MKLAFWETNVTSFDEFKRYGKKVLERLMHSKKRLTLLASCNYKATNEEPGNSFDLMFLVCQRKKKKRSPEWQMLKFIFFKKLGHGAQTTSIADNVDHDTNRSITSECVIWQQSHFSSCVTATEDSLVIHFEFFLSLASSLLQTISHSHLFPRVPFKSKLWTSWLVSGIYFWTNSFLNTFTQYPTSTMRKASIFLS